MGAAVERFADGRQVDALVTLGDNDYTESPAAFSANWLGSFGWAAADGLLVAGTLGNHDIRVDGGRYEFELLGMPGRYYQRRLGDVELFLLDSNRLGAEPARLARLGAGCAPGRSGRSWRCTIPPTAAAATSATRACGGDSSRSSSAHDVDLVLAAHDHNYQRFAGRPASPTSSTAAAGPASIRCSPCPESFPRRVEARERHGWLYLRADAGSLRVRAIGRRGGVLDGFRIYP